MTKFVLLIYFYKCVKLKVGFFSFSFLVCKDEHLKDFFRKALRILSISLDKKLLFPFAIFSQKKNDC